MTESANVRWATGADDAALRRLCVRTPMEGPVSYCLEREPEFFALTRLQGDHGGRVAVVDHGPEIVAMAMMASCRAWVGGSEETCSYIGDLKVDPGHRGKGLAGLLVNFLGRELESEGISRLYFLALAGNPAKALVDDAPGHFRVSTLSMIRNFLVPFGRPKRRRSGAFVSSATSEAIPEMIALWNRNQRSRAFAPVLDESLLTDWLSRLRGLDDFRLVHRDGALKGFCAIWDASAMKQLRLLRLSPGMRAAVAMYNIVATVGRRQRFPPVGQTLRFLYVSHVCAASAEDLDALLVAVHNEKRGAGYLYFDIALDPSDPLTTALSRFRSMKVDFELREARLPYASLPMHSSVSDGCSYFDVSLV